MTATLDALAMAMHAHPRRWHRWRVHATGHRQGVTTEVTRWFVLRCNADRYARLCRAGGVEARMTRVPAV